MGRARGRSGCNAGAADSDSDPPTAAACVPLLPQSALFPDPEVVHRAPPTSPRRSRGRSPSVVPMHNRKWNRDALLSRDVRGAGAVADPGRRPADDGCRAVRRGSRGTAAPLRAPSLAAPPLRTRSSSSADRDHSWCTAAPARGTSGRSRSGSCPGSSRLAAGGFTRLPWRAIIVSGGRSIAARQPLGPSSVTSKASLLPGPTPRPYLASSRTAREPEPPRLDARGTSATPVAVTLRPPDSRRFWPLSTAPGCRRCRGARRADCAGRRRPPRRPGEPPARGHEARRRRGSAWPRLSRSRARACA